MLSYASDQVFVSFTGVDLTPGLAEGSYMVVRRNAPTWSQRPNGVGGTIRLFNPDRSGEVDLLIETESRTNQQLLALAGADRATKAIQGPLYVKDNNTGEAFVFTNAYITTEPDEQRATSSVPVTWTFGFTTIEHVPNLQDNNVVGN